MPMEQCNSAVTSDMSEAWTMPAWMEPFRDKINNTGGNKIEDLMQQLENPYLMRTNMPLAVLALAVDAQILLLGRLHRDGLLVDGEPKRGLRTKEARAERVKWLATQEGLLWTRAALPQAISGPFRVSPADHQWHQAHGKEIVQALIAKGLYAKKTHWRGVNVVGMLREAAGL